MGKYKDIDGYPMYVVCCDGYVINKRTKNILHGHGKKTGYREVTLKGDDGKKRDILLHRLIAAAFCEKRDGADEVNHINGDKADNRAVNLEWTTHAENLKHAYRTGLRADDVSPRAIIATNMETGEQIEFSSIYKAARFMNISKGNICMCCKGLRPYANGYYWEYSQEGDE